MEWLIHPVKDVAANFEIDLEGSWRLILGSLAAQADQLETTVDDDNPAHINFGTAALYLQSSTQVYSKKVDYVYAQVIDVLNYISGNKGRDAAQKKALRGRGPREAQRLCEEEEEFGDGDDGAEEAEGGGRRPQTSKHFPLASFSNDTHANPAPHLFTNRMPMSLLPLEDFEKMNIPIQPKSRTELIGKRDDYAMNGCDVDPNTGALLLDIYNLNLIDREFSFLEEPAPVSSEESGGVEEDGEGMEPGERAGAAETATMEAGRNGEATTRPSDQLGLGLRSITSALQGSKPPTRASERLSNLRELRSAEIAAEISADQAEEEQEDEEEEDIYATAADLGIATVRPRAGKHSRRPDRLWKMLLDRKRKSGDENYYLSRQKEVLMPLKDYLYPSRRATAKLPANYKPYVPLALESHLYTEYKRRQALGRPMSESARKRAQDRRRAQTAALAVVEAPEAPELEVGGAEEEEEMDVSVEGGWGDEGTEPAALGDEDFRSGTGYTVPTIGSYEGLVEFHCSRYFEQANAKLRVSDVTKRVQEWEKRVQPRLEEEEQRRDFRIHEYGSEVLAAFHDIGEHNAFTELTGGLERWEIPRYFLSCLIMANTRNVQLAERTPTTVKSLEEAVDTMDLEYISAERHHEAFL